MNEQVSQQQSEQEEMQGCVHQRWYTTGRENGAGVVLGMWLVVAS